MKQFVIDVQLIVSVPKYFASKTGPVQPESVDRLWFPFFTTNANANDPKQNAFRSTREPNCQNEVKFQQLISSS